MKKLLLLLFAITAVIISAAPRPEAAISLLYDRENVTVNADGTSSTSDACIYQILNHEGVQQMRNLTLHYNSDYGTLAVTHLAIVKPDGRRIVIDPAKNSAVATESSQMDSAIFDPAQKVLNVNVPGLEIGDKLEVTTLKKQTKARMPGEFSDIAVLQADFPIKYYEYTVDVPAEKPLFHCVKDEVPGTLKFTQKKAGSRLIYTWIAQDVPLAVPEPAMPAMYTCTQRVLTSTVKYWEDISRWYYRLCEAHLAKVNAPIKAKTAELISGKKTDMEKITALFQFVSQQIRYTGVTDEESAPGYEPHDVDKTFNQKHGVCRDKAALLTAMLKEAGFRAYPTLFMSGTPKDKEIANIYFNHAIVAVEKADGQYILMDPTFETTTELFPGYLAGDSYLAAKPQGDTLRTAPPVKAESNLLKIDTRIKQNSARMEIKFSGTYDNIYRSAFSQWKPDDIQAFFAARLRKIMPGAELTGVKIFPKNVRDMSKDLAVDLIFKLPGSTLSDTRPTLVNLPRAAFVLGILDSMISCTALQNRRFPLRVMPRAVQEKLTMEVPEGFQYELPGDIDLTEKGLLRLKNKSSFRQGEICEEFFIALDTMLVAPQDYVKFRTAAALARRSRENLPIARKKENYTAEGANCEAILLRRHYDIIDQHSWKYTVRSVTRVLNYAGMKELSNFTIDFIEGVEKFDVQAVVTDSKGKKHPVTPKDIQIMDNKTTASVPRYAKRKTAVVTLPGVDVNSTIDLTVTRHVSQQQGFYAEMLTRNTFPVRESELIIEHPVKMKLKISDIPAGIQDSATFGGKRIIRRYTMKNIPRLPDEPGQPGLTTFIPALKISSVDIAELENFYVSAAQKQVEAVSPEIAELAKKITAGKNSITAAAEAVEKYVYRHIRKVDLPLKSMLRSDFSAPQVTLRDGCGSSADRAILIAAMLKSLRIEYDFIPVTDKVFTSEDDDLLRSFPTNVCSELLIKISADGETFYLNDSGLHAKFNTRRHAGYMMLNNGSFDVLSESESLFKHFAFNVTLKEDLSAEVRLKYSPQGIHLEKIREQFAAFTPATARQFFEKYAASIAPQAEIKESKFENDELILKLNIPDYAKRSGKFITLPLPQFSIITAAAAIPAKKRQTPYFHDTQQQLIVDYEVSAPEKFCIVKPEKYNISAGTFTFSGDYLFYNRKHLFGFGVTELTGISGPETFEHLREINRKINHSSTGNILFTTE